MIKSTEKWTSVDLELFHDEQLDEKRVAQLSKVLRRDPKLRMRLADVRRIDDLVRTAFLEPRQPRVYGLSAFTRLALAACLFMAVAGSWLAWSRPEKPINAPGAFDTTSLPPPAIRVIFSLPLRRQQEDTTTPRSAAIPSLTSEREFLSRLDRALGAGQIEETLHLLGTASARQRQQGYRHIAAVLRSAQVAESILDRLSPDEQLAVCGEWAVEPTIRPTVFTRLQRLAQEPSIANHYGSVLAVLSKDPALRAWLRGYQLLEQG